MPWHTSPRERALRILERVDSGEIVTPGGWADVVYHLERLPPRLQEWCWNEIEARIGPDAARYLQQFARQPQGAVTVATR